MLTMWLLCSRGRKRKRKIKEGLILGEFHSRSSQKVKSGLRPYAPYLFVTTFVSTPPEHEVGDYTDSMVVPNLHTIRAPQRFVIYSDSSHHSSANVAEAEVDSLVRSSAPIMMTVTTVTSMVDSALVAKEKPIKPFLFSADSSLAGGANPNTGAFWILPIATFFMTNGSHLDDGHVCREMVDEFAPPKFFAFVHGMEHDQLFTEFNVGATRQISLSAEVRMRTEYNVKERRRLKSVVEKQDELLKAKDGEIEDLRAQLLLKEIEAVEATRLCAQSSNLEAIEKSLQDEVSAFEAITGNPLKRSGYALDVKVQAWRYLTLPDRQRRSRCKIIVKEQLKKLQDEPDEIIVNDKLASWMLILRKVGLEWNALDVKVTDLKASVVGKERYLTDLNAQLTSAKSQNVNLVDRVHELEISSARLQEKIMVYDNCMEQLKKFQDDRMKVVNDKLAKLDADLAELACHLEERFYLHLLNTISGRRWLLTHGLKLFLVKCLNSSEYLTALRATISRAIEKGMQSGLLVGIDHGREGRSLANVDAYNSDAEADFNSAFQNFCEVDFPLLAELKSHKDASTKDIMNVLRLEGSLADAPGMNDLQPDIDHVSHSRVERIRENIAAQQSALVGVWTPLSEPLSITSLMGEASTSGVVPAASVTTTVLSTTFTSANSIPPISTDDFEIVGVDGQEGAGTDGQVIADRNISPFPNVDDVELNIPQ
ncbi:hypothetical protein Tco_0391235 [Tanacetum coccineum]